MTVPKTPIRPAGLLARGAAGLLAMAAAVALWIGRTPGASGEGGVTASVPHHAMDDGAILDALNDALDGG